MVQRAHTSCAGLAHTLIRLSYRVEQPAWPECQLGLLFRLVASINEHMRGWPSSLQVMQGNRGPPPELPQCPAFPLSPMSTLKMKEEGERQELRLQPDHTAPDGSSDSSARDWVSEHVSETVVLGGVQTPWLSPGCTQSEAGE